ncbi:MAG TPA: CAP domain-containing protein [Spirochaetia bacterium]|nr:CAP domain-containing protein [Spirochaetia bacterium]
MKRPLPAVAPFACLLAMVVVPPVVAGGESALDWANRLRAAGGAPRVQGDELLSSTARDWARTLAAAGAISHRGADGEDALDRYRAHGGTEVRIGEIIGAGPGLAAIEKAWEASPSHRELALRKYWTHAGMGESQDDRGGDVCVMLFCVVLVEGLEISIEKTELVVKGRFDVQEASDALLMAGIEAHRPEAWDRVSRSFAFRLAAAGLPSYVRLGFATAKGAFTLTNALTLPTEREFPGGRARFSVPGARH